MEEKNIDRLLPVHTFYPSLMFSFLFSGVFKINKDIVINWPFAYHFYYK